MNITLGKPVSLSDCKIGQKVMVQDVDDFHHGNYAEIIALHPAEKKSICVHLQYSSHPTYFQPEQLRLIAS